MSSRSDQSLRSKCRTKTPKLRRFRKNLTAATSVFALLLSQTTAHAVPMDLFFSEYIEGSSNNKALEIYNGTGSAIDLDAGLYDVQFYFNGNSNPGSTIALNGNVASMDVFVVADNNANAAILSQADQTPTNSFFNGDDAIVLRKNGTIIDSIGQIGVDPGTQWGSGLTSTQNNTLRRNADTMVGDTDTSNAFDPATEWTGFAQDSVDQLGTFPDAAPPPVAERKIYEIQGENHVSAFDGEAVKTTGIVTALASNGFYVQDPDGDGNDATSDGVFVFTGGAPSVAVGDDVEVTGSVSEFTPGGAASGNTSITQISSLQSVTTSSSGNSLPASTIIGSSGRVPPTETIETGDFNSSFDPATDGIDFYESLEGMIVTVEDAQAVSPTNRFGEITTVANQGANATNQGSPGLNSRGGINLDENDANPERLQIDDGLLPSNSPTVNTGDKLGDVTGVISYSFGNYELLPTEEFTPTDGGLTREVTNLVGTEDQLTVASYNVLNLDPGDGDQRFADIAGQIVSNLLSPDIVGLQEVQDNTGPTNDGVTSASETAQLLIDAIAAAGGPTYTYVEIPPEDGQDGGQPGGNIRVGYLYNDDRVDLAEASVERILDTDGDDAFTATRKSLAAKFIFNGEEVTIINNHLSSKGGSTPLFGTTQPSTNGRVDNRTAQVGVLLDFIQEVFNADPDANIIALGDFNEFLWELPLELLSQVLTDLLTLLDLDDQYTFNFQGNSQALDHFFVSANLLGLALPEIDILHINTEFADQASDHDPIVSRFSFGQVVASVPEPGTLALMLFGLVAFGLVRRRDLAQTKLQQQ
ncbi:endonuclease/exonuclease/phosphatase family protein [Pelagibius sp. Alg239-R121]|uniref:lamin tail domain-containing protein n=1 Tax=Pelagibius sp. Alg239-R121 TaxID=2993448 RepID=UPI0024A7A411|nr:endonuclease/exonuclease/phosphatase family protein [Pelagibius sp. Alg239-R121]